MPAAEMLPVNTMKRQKHQFKDGSSTYSVASHDIVEVTVRKFGKKINQEDKVSKKQTLEPEVKNKNPQINMLEKELRRGQAMFFQAPQRRRDNAFSANGKQSATQGPTSRT